jgi:hypothetical protein
MPRKAADIYLPSAASNEFSFSLEAFFKHFRVILWGLCTGSLKVLSELVRRFRKGSKTF